MMRPLLFAALTTFSMQSAYAQDLGELDDPDSGAEEREEPKRERAKPEVKEITKGWYAKSNIGGAGYLGKFLGFVNAGTAVGLTVGQDFLDQEKKSAAWELGLIQGVHNGCGYQEQADYACNGNLSGKDSPYIQGDLRTYTLQGALEYSVYPNRRFGIGGRAVGGLLLSPLLIHPTYYDEEVLPEWGRTANPPTYHDRPHPMVGGGVTVEYYTRLSHFSIGADADVFYAIGFDLGFNASGYLKYTF
jgi:hypothetical protein